MGIGQILSLADTKKERGTSPDSPSRYRQAPTQQISKAHAVA